MKKVKRYLWTCVFKPRLSTTILAYETAFTSLLIYDFKPLPDNHRCCRVNFNGIYEFQPPPNFDFDRTISGETIDIHMGAALKAYCLCWDDRTFFMDTCIWGIVRSFLSDSVFCDTTTRFRVSFWILSVAN